MPRIVEDIVSSLPAASPLFVNWRSWGKRGAHFQPLNSERSCFVNLSALSPGRCSYDHQPIGKYVELHDNMLSLVEPGKKLWAGKKLVPNLGNAVPGWVRAQ